MITFLWKNSPASKRHVEVVGRVLGLASKAFPIEAWKISDGGGLTDEIVLYAISEIEERNDTFDVARNFPDKIAVGDDSGGRLLMVARDGGEGFYLVDSGSPSLDGAEFFSTLGELLIGEEGSSNSDIGKIMSIGKRSPTGREILYIKKGLALEVSISDLKARLASPKSVLLDSVSKIKYLAALETYADLIAFELH